MCPSGYLHNNFVATDALGHIMYRTSCDHVPKCMSCHKVIVVITGRAHCFHDFMIAYIYHAHYMYIYIYIYTQKSFALFNLIICKIPGVF